jgi:transposase-like protein
MAKLTKQTVAAVSKGKKETVAKPKTGPKTAPKVTAKPAATKAPVKPKVTKAATKAVAKTPVKTPRKTTVKTPVKAPVKTEVKAEPVEVPKIPTKAVLAKSTLSPRTKKVENKPRKPRKPRSFKTDTSKFRKYNNELRINLRNLIYDKGYSIAHVAREIGVVPSYLFNILKVNKKSKDEGGGNDSVVVLDIAYAVCESIGANISSVLPVAEVVNPVYKSSNDLTNKIDELQEENTRLNFLYTQTKNQADVQSLKLTKAEARVKELEGVIGGALGKLQSASGKLQKIKEKFATAEEQKVVTESEQEGSHLEKAKYI